MYSSLDGHKRLTRETMATALVEGLSSTINQPQIKGIYLLPV